MTGGRSLMKTIFRVLPLLFLGGCEDSDAFRVGTVLVNSITQSPEKIPRERAAQVPYASMGLEIGATPQLLLVLGTAIGNELDWFAGDEVFVRTRKGRIVRTVGLPYDLGGVRELTTTANVATAAEPSAIAQYSFDFPELGVFGADARCTRKDMGEASVEILGAAISTRHIVEHCAVPAMRWNFDNDYWTDRTSGYVWRSSQHIHPDSPPVILEVFRPEQNPA
jgi:hypothetical protein